MRQSIAHVALVVQVVLIVHRRADDPVIAGIRHRARKPVDVGDRRFSLCRAYEQGVTLRCDIAIGGFPAWAGIPSRSR
ncbi:MAG TPA: hypothetical protein VFZ51_10790 [Woeseiaceae bacterium]